MLDGLGLAQAVVGVGRHDGVDGGVMRRYPFQGVGHDGGGAGLASAHVGGDRQG